MSDRIGFAEVSSYGHDFDSLTDALQQAGCGKIFSEKMIGSQMERPVLDQVLRYVRPRDAIVVTEPGRRNRSLPSLLEAFKALEQRGANLLSFRILYEHSEETVAGVCRVTGTERRAFSACPAEKKEGIVQEQSEHAFAATGYSYFARLYDRSDISSYCLNITLKR